MTKYLKTVSVKAIIIVFFLAPYFFPCAAKYRLVNWAETSASGTTAVNLIIEEIQINRIFSRALSKAAS